MKTHLPFADCIVWLRAEPALLQRAHCSSGTGVDEPDLLSSVFSDAGAVSTLVPHAR